MRSEPLHQLAQVNGHCQAALPHIQAVAHAGRPAPTRRGRARCGFHLRAPDDSGCHSAKGQNRGILAISQKPLPGSELPATPRRRVPVGELSYAHAYFGSAFAVGFALEGGARDLS